MNTKRLLAGVAVAAAATAVVPATASAKVDAYVCVVKTTGVPVYDFPPNSGHAYKIVAWVNAPQKITVTTSFQYWLGGTVWGRSDVAYIHSNYLAKETGGPCVP